MHCFEKSHPYWDFVQQPRRESCRSYCFLQMLQIQSPSRVRKGINSTSRIVNLHTLLYNSAKPSTSLPPPTPTGSWLSLPLSSSILLSLDFLTRTDTRFAREGPNLYASFSRRYRETGPLGGFLNPFEKCSPAHQNLHTALIPRHQQVLGSKDGAGVGEVQDLHALSGPLTLSHG